MADSTTAHTQSPRPNLQRRGLLFILSSPSGAGKTTISRMLLAADDEIKLSVSVTTRPPRAGEIDGVHYSFVDDATFDRMVEEDDFYEWAHVFDHRYGTPKGAIRNALKEGQDFLFDIDWQGTQQVANAARTDLVSVFILPPSREALQQRLISRAQDSADVVAGRMAKASDEISHYREYDYIVVNDDLEESVRAVSAILAAERLKRDRQIGMTDFVRRLQSEDR